MRTAIAFLLIPALVSCAAPETAEQPEEVAIAQEEQEVNLITIEEFNLLEEGMSLSDVEAILGQKTDGLSVDPIEGNPFTRYKWSNPPGDGYIVIVFEDGRLYNSNSYGIPSQLNISN